MTFPLHHVFVMVLYLRNVSNILKGKLVSHPRIFQLFLTQYTVFIVSYKVLVLKFISISISIKLSNDVQFFNKSGFKIRLDKNHN